MLPLALIKFLNYELRKTDISFSEEDQGVIVIKNVNFTEALPIANIDELAGALIRLGHYRNLIPELNDTPIESSSIVSWDADGMNCKLKMKTNGFRPMLDVGDYQYNSQKISLP